MKRQLTCMCEKSFDADFPELVDLSQEPKTLEEILKGNFMTATCPSCGKILKPEFPFKLIHKEKNWDIRFIPEMERVSFLKNLKPKKGKKERIVIGYPELIEKIAIFKQDLDDKIIEYLKYYLLSQILEKTDEEKNIFIYFSKKKGNNLIFNIKGLKKDEIGVYKMPVATYEKAALDIDKKIKIKPFSEFLIPPYVSLNKIYLWVTL